MEGLVFFSFFKIKLTFFGELFDDRVFISSSIGFDTGFGYVLL